MPFTNIQKVRFELGDIDPVFQILTDSEYEYFLEKHQQVVRRASLDAAKTILFKLSLQGEGTVDIFSLKGAAAAEAYRLALYMYIKNPDLNEVYSNAQGYFGGVSKADMEANNGIPDNNVSPFSDSSEYDRRYFND